MGNVTFSVIIPTLNEEKIIGKTLSQFLEYKKKHPERVEIIVSDDKSSDRTVKIAKKFADKVILFKGGEKYSAGDCRNRGAKIAKGGILVFLDADIILEDVDSFFTELLKVFVNNNVIAVAPKVEVYPWESKPIDKIIRAIGNMSVMVLNLLGIGRVSGGCYAVRASHFKKINGFHRHLAVAEDQDLFYRLSRLGKTKFLSKVRAYESPRRYRKYGYFRVIFVEWTIKGIINHFFPTKVSWKQIR